MHDTKDAACRTGRTQGRKDAGQEGCRTERKRTRRTQGRKDAGQKGIGCMTGRMQGRKDAGQEECKQEECRTEWDAERVRCRKVGIFFGLLQWCSGDENGERIAKNQFKFL